LKSYRIEKPAKPPSMMPRFACRIGKARIPRRYMDKRMLGHDGGQRRQLRLKRSRMTSDQRGLRLCHLSLAAMAGVSSASGIICRGSDGVPERFKEFRASLKQT
jgi:hypothetical protein